MSGIIHVGCVAIVKKDKSLLLGLRQNCYGAGTWGLPGGHLEFRERLMDAVRRELKEEIDLDVSEEKLKLAIVADSGLDEGEHHVQICFELEYSGEKIRNNEPHKCAELRFFSLDDLPKNIFSAHTEVLSRYLSEKRS